MSGRLLPARMVRCLCLVPSLVLAHSSLALAQDAPPSAPTAPPEAVAPPPADAPAPAPSVPGPPAQAPTAPLPTPTPAPATPSPAEPPSGSAAFEPLPESAPAPKRPKAQPKQAPKPQPVPAPVAPASAPAPAPEPRYDEPARTAPAPVSHAEYEPKKDDESGALGPFRIGFLIGTGLPEVANLGGQIKITRFIGAGVNVGLIPTVKIAAYGDATVSYQEYDAYGRIYPFGGAFFLGAGVGYATIKGTFADTVNLSAVQAQYPGLGIPASLAYTSEASVRTLVLTPQIGFMKIFDVGFAIGLDVGAQIPIAPSNVEFATAAPQLPDAVADVVRRQYLNPNDDKVRSTLENIGRTPLPTFNFKIGWFL